MIRNQIFIATLVGAPEKDIQDRLMEFYKQEKLKEKTLKFNPFFSNLLQSRAALLQADNSPGKKEAVPLLPSDFLLRSSQRPPVSVAGQDSAVQKPWSARPSPAEAHTERQDKSPDSNCKSSVKAAASAPKPSVVQPVKEISFPLVRSKSGRIILPASLKPSKGRPCSR